MRNQNRKNEKNKHPKHIFYENDFIWNCDACHVPLIGEVCGLCQMPGRKVFLSQPADVRFAHAYDYSLIDKLIREAYGCNPLKNRLLLLNKIPGDDRAFEIMADGFVFGTVRYDLQKRGYVFEPSARSVGIFMSDPYRNATAKKTVVVQKTQNHLNGKKLEADCFEVFPPEIEKDDFIFIKSQNLIGYGVALVSGKYFQISKNKKNTEKKPVVRVRTVISDKTENVFKNIPDNLPTKKELVAANVKKIRELGKSGINMIRGFANQNQYKKMPVYVSFSGGKDSLVCLDLARSALPQKSFSTVFLNTGIDFPETVNFVYEFCEKNKLNLIELKAQDAFWKEMKKNGHPTKDDRWCCSVCKLNSANAFHKGKKHIAIDGKRKHESFARATIPPSCKNPQIPGQINVFPIRDWKALEVWLYIYWRELEYNPLYEAGFERIGCWMCPAAFEAEYELVKQMHPELTDKWDSYLTEWAEKENYPEYYIKFGFWRWKKLPPKMELLSKKIKQQN